MSSSFCGTLIPCSEYFTSNPFELPLITLFSWNYTILAGYNKFPFTQVFVAPKGSFLMLVQSTGRLGIDINSNSTYSDMLINNGAYYKLNEFSNWRFYLNAIVSFSSYISDLRINHIYSLVGSYEIAITFLSSMAVFRHTIKITQSNFYSIIKK